MVLQARLLEEVSTRPAPSNSSVPYWDGSGTTVTVAALAVRAMERRAALEVDVADAVAVGHEERRRRARSPHGRAETRSPLFVSSPLSTTSTSQPFGNVGRELADHLRAVAGGQDEAPEALLRVDPHDVQQDRLAVDVEKRLRQLVGVRIGARAAPAAEDECGDLHVKGSLGNLHRISVRCLIDDLSSTHTSRRSIAKTCGAKRMFVHSLFERNPRITR